jgi:hypothetical protein
MPPSPRPVPERADDALTPAPAVAVRVAASLPTMLGEKVMAMVQVLPTARVPVQVSALGMKSAELPPLTATLTVPLVAVPVLVTVKVVAALEEPSATEPKAWVGGVTERVATPPEELPEEEELDEEELEEDEDEELDEEPDEDEVVVAPASPAVPPPQPAAKARAREARTAVFRNRFELKREDVVVIVFFSTGFSPLKQLFKQLFSSTGFPPSKANSRARA